MTVVEIEDNSTVATVDVSASTLTIVEISDMASGTIIGLLNTHIADITTHGTTGDIVGTSDTQSLTNKTITPVKIVSPGVGGILFYASDGVTQIAVLDESGNLGIKGRIYTID